jgi:hypothetical protein
MMASDFRCGSLFFEGMFHSDPIIERPQETVIPFLPPEGARKLGAALRFLERVIGF